MPRAKPAGWPRHMLAKRISGATAYYWNLPTWARKAGLSMKSEPLGKDYAEAKKRCDEILNPQLDAWRTGRDVPAIDRNSVGSFDWAAGIYKSGPKYKGKTAKTRKSYDAALHLVSAFKLKDGRRFGELQLASITAGAADRIYAKLRLKADGTHRDRTALLAMTVCRLMWSVARREKPDVVPLDNPFAGMALEYKAVTTRPVTYEEMIRLVAAADAAGERSIGTAAMIAFFWLQRQVDILTRLSWGHYRPADAPDTVNIFHHKTGEMVAMPLVDDDGSDLWPELTTRLDAEPRHGTLIVTRDVVDKRRKVRLPWSEHYFRHRIAALRIDAKVDPSAKFMGLRHGGNTEGADADLSDAQLRALSGHKTTSALILYAQTSKKQRLAGARKRRNARTKKEGLSE